MPRCPACGHGIDDVDELAQEVFRSGQGGTTMWSCPECNAIVGISDWE